MFFLIHFSKIIIKNASFLKIGLLNSYLFIYFQSFLNIEKMKFFNCSSGLLSFSDSNTTIFNSVFNQSEFSSFLDPCITSKKSLSFQLFSIENSSFSGFLTIKNGSIISLFGFNGIFSLNNCSFYSNKANEYGGTLFLFLSGKIIIKNCLFKNNSAINGGAIYFFSFIEDETNRTMELINNVFEQNQAVISGGAMKFFKGIPLDFLNNNIFLRNRAGNYGDDYSSEPYRILFLNENQTIQKVYSINDFQNKPFLSLKVRSGEVLSKSLKFVVVDNFYQTIFENFNE